VPVAYSDQFDVVGPGTATALLPFELCNPVDKNGEGIADAEAHLLCYKLLNRKRRARADVIDTDQFGSEELGVRTPAIELCLPAIKNGEGDLDALEARLNHFACYHARTARGAPALIPGPVTLADQFETKETDVLRTNMHCNPLFTKNGQDFSVDPDNHLKCYAIRDLPDQRPFRGREVTTQDQFGELTLRAGRPTRLCEPASKELQ
jgi:hypothetical protein